MPTGKEHQAKGMLEKAKGALKEGFGAFTGNRRTEVDGKMDRAKGSVRQSYGEVKDRLTSDPNDPTSGL